MPVVGNGDVACFEGLKRMRETGVDGVMMAVLALVDLGYLLSYRRYRSSIYTT